MFRSESIINNLLLEIDSLCARLANIQQTFCNTTHEKLRERLIYENKNITQRIIEIYLISKELNKKNNENISFSSLLLERCKRAIYQNKSQKNLFFL